MALTPIFAKDVQKRKAEPVKYEEPIEKPIIPSQNGCCTKICEILNNEITESIELIKDCEKLQDVKIQITPTLEEGIMTKTCRTNAKKRVGVLTELRFKLASQGSCKCAEFPWLKT